MEIFKAKPNMYILFLCLVIVFSYGQLLGMYVWQDDNALFFKLANIEGRAGYLGAGPFGDGAYKYTATPYIPIYYIFGFNTIAYFLVTFILYILTTLFVYKVFAKILGEVGGRVAGFIYACGYIASDGFIRLFNSVITSGSIITISLLTLSYWKFYQEKKIKWYFLAVLFYFLSVEFAAARSHYLIGTIVLFELFFLSFREQVKSLFFSGVRLLPFFFIFYNYFILNADHRSGQVKNLIIALFKGEFFQLFSFLSSLSNLIVPQWFVDSLFKIHDLSVDYLRMGIYPSRLIIILTLVILAFLFFKERSKVKLLFPILGCLAVIWTLVYKNIFSTPVLNLSNPQLFSVYLGGILLIYSLVLFIVVKNLRKFYLFLILWIIINTLAYAAYNPVVTYDAINRYHAHSFFALCGLCGLFAFNLYQGSVKKRWLMVFVIAWGISNLTSSIFYQHKILQNRSTPAREFYQQLKVFVPDTSKGDIFYFDVSDNSRSYYQDAFSVAQMPETTAIAWRYGLDRYDIEIFNDFESLVEYVQSKDIADPERIHSFWYSNKNLVDTSHILREVLFRKPTQHEIPFKTLSDGVIEFERPIASTTPIEIYFDIQANLADSNSLSFPYHNSTVGTLSTISKDHVKKELAVKYKKDKESMLVKTKFQASSEWRERKINNLKDQNPDTIWQADRLKWQKRNESFTLDIGSPQSINKFVWVNGFGNNTPIQYSIEVSLDGQRWQVVKQVSEMKRVDTKDPQVIEFDPIVGRFFKMVITNTIGGDSPAIADTWVVQSRFKELDVKEAENFIKNPFEYVENDKDYNTLVSLLENEGKAQVYWYGDKTQTWSTQPDKEVKIIFDGGISLVKVVIPAGGTEVSKIKLSNISIPGNIHIKKIRIKQIGLNESIY